MARLTSLAKGFLRLAWARATGQRFPLNVYFAVTNRCNLDCYYCYGDYHHRQGVREFTLAEITDTLRELRRMGTVFLQLQGGEPLLRNDLGAIVDCCRELGFSTDLITNAILIPQRTEVIRRLDSICISIDGRPALTDANRGTGTFARVLDGIDCCRELGVPTRLNAMLTADTTREEVDYLLRLAAEKKLLLNFSSTFHFVPRSVRSGGGRSLRPADDHLRRLLAQIAAQKRAGGPLQFTAQAYERARDWPLPFDRIRATAAELPAGYDYFPCRHGDYVLFIDADGRLYPCCNFWNADPVLNLHEAGFAAAWERVARGNCAACYTFSYIDRNGLLNLSPRQLANYLGNVFK